jgi:hypothetical protein
METTPIWLIDAAWISFAFFCGFLARLVKLPPMIGFLAAGFLLTFTPLLARFEDQAEELREMGVHSVYNIYANVGPAYADYVRKAILEHPVFSVELKGETGKTSA